MKEITLIEIQKVEMDILRDFHNVCEKHHLRYSLIYGTLIGAVRHQGFIPWDDDIDVVMPREDYKKLLALPKNVFQKEHTLCAHEITKGYIHPIGKLIDNRTVLKEKLNIETVQPLGIYIDIFPADKVPIDEDERNKFHLCCMKNARNLAFSVLQYSPTGNIFKNILKKTVLGVFHLRGSKRYLKILDQYIAYSEKLNSDDLKIIAFPENKKNEIKASLFDECILIPFEDGEFRVLPNYHELLTTQYGDYMQLPKEEERISPHDSIIYWKK